jgi:hypothetical protein
MKTNRKSPTARKAPFLTSLALACAFMTGSAGAGIPVTDVGNMPNHIITQIQSYLNQLNTYASKIQDATHQARDYQHMIQQLTQLDQMFQQALLSYTQNFQKRSEFEGVAERCKGGSGSIVSDLVSSFGLNLNGDIVAQQKALCTYIVMLQNKKYNDQVDAMQKLLTETQRDITRQHQQIGSSRTNGAMDTNTAVSTAGIQQVLANYQQTQQRIQMYDSIISTLKEDQRQLARRALDGQSSIIGAMVSTAALATALELND